MHQQKRQWCKAHNITYLEQRYSKTMQSIILDLSKILQLSLKTPSSTYLQHYSNEMNEILAYLSTHSARQTMKDLNVPVTKLRHYVSLQGYLSISDWQRENNLY